MLECAKVLPESSRNLTMKIALRLGILVLALAALPATVHAYGCPLFPCARPCTVQLGPWYLYYPYEAHFQTSAPLGPYPNWQPGMAVAPAPAAYSPPVQAPWTPPAPQPLVQPSSYIQPAGFNYSQPPSYWYGR
jgi:hypothetical protein